MMGYTLRASLKAVLIYPTDINNMPIAPALWFIPCMFYAVLLYSLLSKLTWSVKDPVVAMITVAGMIYSSMFDVMLPFAIETMAVALGFMLVGEIIKRNQNITISRIDRWWVIIILLGIEAVLAIVNGSVDMRSARYNNGILYNINSITGTLAY